VVGALQAGLLLAMVWLVWSYTTWVTNWLDPELMAVRLLLVLLMLVNLAMSASLPRAFEDLGLWVGGATRFSRSAAPCSWCSRCAGTVYRVPGVPRHPPNS
jgi:low temperature requirement protein LtrA